MLQCLQMLWQQLEDILTLMDSELLHEDTTSDQPVKVCSQNGMLSPSDPRIICPCAADVDRNGENSVSEKLLAEKLCEVFSGDASLLACSVSSSTPTPKIEEKDKSGSFSPAVPRVCALIRAFYMCSQSNKNRFAKFKKFLLKKPMIRLTWTCRSFVTLTFKSLIEIFCLASEVWIYLLTL